MNKKVIAVVTAFAMLTSTFSMVFASPDSKADSKVQQKTYSDISGHWASEAINKWSGYGVISGNQGIFRPNASITRGEMACIPIVDSLCRLIPGVLSKDESYIVESFYQGVLEYPQYTRPECFNGDSVPEILLSGHHENIRKWRRLQSLKITKEKRPDLFKKLILSKEDSKLIR
jgi:hypothetical protein